MSPTLPDLVADMKASVEAVLAMLRREDPANSSSTATTEGFRAALGMMRFLLLRWPHMYLNLN